MKSKSGFNLIELAIVLALIGTVIGGIYIAAGAVNENYKQRKLQKQVLAIVTNIRTIYNGNLVSAITPTYAESQILNIFPADMPGDGMGFIHAYGGRTVLTFFTGLAFRISLEGLPASGCISLLSSMYASSTLNNSFWRSSSVSTGTGNAELLGGLSVGQAAAICNLPANNVQMTFPF